MPQKAVTRGDGGQNGGISGYAMQWLAAVVKFH